MKAHRRNFFKSAAAAGIAAFAGLRPLTAADAEIELDPSQPGPEINPHIYGHFIEHLGGVIYDGIWVGRNSKVPNLDGIRKQFVDDMKRIGAPNLRWPGGCFADGYHWRDGIGAAERRPRTYNYWEHRMPPGLNHTESNEFGTHEFMRLCRLVGAEPYVAANVGSGSPQEFHDWVSYGNAPRGTLSLAQERARNGDEAPFNIKYWGVGNESWGCGGNMSGGEYATLYRQYIAQVPVYLPPLLRGHGPARALRRRRRRLDRGLLRGTAERARTGGPGGRLCPPLLHRLPPDQGRRSHLRREGVVRRPPQGRPHRESDRRPLGHHGQVRSPAPHEVRHRRVGQLVQGRYRARSRVHPEPGDHPA